MKSAEPDPYIDIRIIDGKMHLVIPNFKEVFSPEQISDQTSFVLRYLSSAGEQEMTEALVFSRYVGLIRHVIRELDLADNGYGLKTFGRTCAWNHAEHLKNDEDVSRLAATISVINTGSLDQIRITDPKYFKFALNTAAGIVGQYLDYELEQENNPQTLEYRSNVLSSLLENLPPIE